MKPMKYHPLWLAISALIVVSLACNISIPLTQTPATLATPTASGPLPTPPPGVYPPGFAEYPLVQVNLPASFGGSDYSLPVDLNAVQGMDFLTLSPEARALLSQNGFVVLPPNPGEFREFYQLYESHRYDQANLFITTDSIYHIYHLIFSKMLRDLERDYFIADLNALTSAMLTASYQQYQTLRGSSLEEAALRNVAFFAVEIGRAHV